MKLIKDYLKAKKTVGITGHVRPDGDCVGSCLALYHYICLNYPEIIVDLYLEPFSEKFMFLSGTNEIKYDCLDETKHDLFIVLDTSEKSRMGDAIKYFDTAEDTLNIDHHISNNSFANSNIIVSNASSASEVLYDLLEEEKINKTIAECIYTGIIFDSGVFKYSNTSEKTMKIAGKLMSYDIDFGKIIDESFYRKTYNQNKIMGRAFLDSKLALDQKCVYTVLTQKHLDEFNITSKDLDGIIDQLRVISGVECAIFLHEVEDSVYKISFRSNDYLDVNKVANEFGGGGHVRASGCTLQGSVEGIISRLLTAVEKQI